MDFGNSWGSSALHFVDCDKPHYFLISIVPAFWFNHRGLKRVRPCFYVKVTWEVGGWVGTGMGRRIVGVLLGFVAWILRDRTSF